MNAPIRIHSYALSGHAHRVVLFAAIAGIAHEVIEVDLRGGEQRSPEFLRLNPFGQVPVIEDGDVVIHDSNAILVYLAKRYAPAYLPEDPVGLAHVQQFLTMAAGELAYGPAAARRITVFGAELHAPTCMQVSERFLGRLDAHLEGRDVLVGQTATIADIAMYSYTAHAPEGGVSLESAPNVRRFLRGVEALPGFVPMPATKAGLVS